MAKGTSVIQLATNSIADAAASIDMQDDGFVEGAYLGFRVTSVAADGDGGQAEISFGSTSSFNTNDARQVIARGDYVLALATAAAFARSSFSQFYHFGEGLPFFGGERVFLHTAIIAGGLIERIHALLVVSFKGGPIARRR